MIPSGPSGVPPSSAYAETFTNHDQTSHTATSTETAFDTGTVRPEHGAAVVLTKAGTYSYYCQFHGFMRGTIDVK